MQLLLAQQKCVENYYGKYKQLMSLNLTALKIDFNPVHYFNSVTHMWNTARCREEKENKKEKLASTFSLKKLYSLQMIW